MSYSEATFNFTLLHPCLQATATFLRNTSVFRSCFIPGEVPLNAMNNQLKSMGQKNDKRKVYLADGIIRLNDLDGLEILIIETAGPYGSKDERKIAFDNIKGMFGLLAMMKTMADRFCYASVELFQKLKLYLVQASDEHIRLLSMQYVSNGVYIFSHENKIEVSEDADQVEGVLVPLVNFFYHVKTSLAQSAEIIHQLQQQHQEIKTINEGSSSQCVLLSDIICPKVFRLTFNQHGRGFGALSVTSSPEPL